jgi:hypothetical protein
MSVADISFSSEISYHHSNEFALYNVLLFYSLINVGFQYISVFSIIVLFVSHFVLNIIWISGIREVFSLLFLGACP